VVLYTDADLPCDLAEVIRAIRLMGIYDADIVSAWRTDRTAEGPRRAVYSFAYNHLIRWAFGIRVRDINFAFKLVRRSVLDSVQLKSEGSFIDAELLIRAERKGFRIVQFGVDFFPRTRGVSTLSSSATIRRIVHEMTTLRTDLDGPAAAGRPATTEQRLVVNADDYGLTEGVSRGILRAHDKGIVTSTSVLALAPGFDASTPWLKDVPTLGIGAHLALVGEDPPLLSSREIPSLVDNRGRLPLSWKQFLVRAQRGAIDPDDVAREFAAQMERVAGIGVPLTHVDTHQHLHLWPMVREAVVDVAARWDVAAIRIPRSNRRGPTGTGVNYLSSKLVQRADACGLITAGASAGLDEAGRVDLATLERALDTLVASGAPTLELWVHPGEPDDPDRHRYRWNYQWDAELAALTDARARAAIDERGLVLTTYDRLH
jgi:chitin disaccharide deacetylase